MTEESLEEIMNTQGAYFLLLAGMVVSVGEMPVWGQTTTSVPDLSGIWAHLSWPGVERPTSGPGPVTNRSRREGVSDTYQLVGDDTNPILKPEAAEIVK